MPLAVDNTEKYEEWLDRLNIPIEEQEDVEKFKSALARELGEYTEAQYEALSSAIDIQRRLSDLGIRGITIEYPWGNERRYGIQGLSGLWSWASVQQILEAEE